MKKKLSTIGLVLIFIIGFSILMYPTISNYYNKMVGSYSIGKYDGEVSKINEVDLKQIYENAQKYNEDLLKNPTGIKNGESKDKNYISQLRIKENESIIGSVIIDKINVKLPIYHGTSEPVLQKGVGHLEGTTLPIGGIGKHSVLVGHTGLPSAKLFSDLEKMEIDDLVVVKVLDKTLTYKVNNIEIVLPEKVDSLRPVDNKDLLTLLTCTPYGVNSHRLLVHAERTENIDTDKLVNVNVNNEGKYIYIFKDKLFIVGLVIAVAVVIYFIVKKYKVNK